MVLLSGRVAVKSVVGSHARQCGGESGAGVAAPVAALGRVQFGRGSNHVGQVVGQHSARRGMKFLVGEVLGQGGHII
jgi:hypothetical protein